MSITLGPAGAWAAIVAAPAPSNRPSRMLRFMAVSSTKRTTLLRTGTMRPLVVRSCARNGREIAESLETAAGYAAARAVGQHGARDTDPRRQQSGGPAGGNRRAHGAPHIGPRAQRPHGFARIARPAHRAYR